MQDGESNQFAESRLFTASRLQFFFFAEMKDIDLQYGRMARGGHGLPKVLPGPAMPHPFTPCGRATPETALRLFQGWLAHRAGRLRLSSTPLNTRRSIPKIRRCVPQCTGLV
jgi:hypothetical protein